MSYSIMELIRIYGDQKRRTGLYEAQAETFAGDIEQARFYKKANAEYRGAEKTLAKIRKILVGD